MFIQLIKQVASRALIPAVLMGGVFLVGVPQAHASRFDECHARIERAQIRLDSDIARHGEFSRQAEHDRARLDNAHAWCSAHGVRPY
jgi:hypothetical protein